MMILVPGINCASTWEGQVEEKVTQGLPKDVAEVEASNLQLPVCRKGHCVNLWKTMTWITRRPQKQQSINASIY